jgi:hypothetical protein
MLHQVMRYTCLHLTGDKIVPADNIAVNAYFIYGSRFTAAAA